MGQYLKVPHSTANAQNSFKMRKQVEKNKDDPERLDIAEKVKGPSPWVSSLVPIPKKDNDVRICVDMRQGNCA